MKSATRVLGWLAVALLGAFAFGVLALHRGETLNSVYLLIAALCAYAIAYLFYSKPALYQAWVHARQVGDAVGLSAAQKNLAANRALHFNHTLDAVVAGVFLVLVGTIVLLSAREWGSLLTGKRFPRLSETLPVWLPVPARITRRTN